MKGQASGCWIDTRLPELERYYTKNVEGTSMYASVDVRCPRLCHSDVTIKYDSKHQINSIKH
jgi:hypothetical protein